MDKNTLIGFLLIALIVVGFTIWQTPSKEQLEAQQRFNDSIAAVQKAKLEAQQAAYEAQMLRESAVKDSLQHDSVAMAQHVESIYGSFAVSAAGDNNLLKVENEKAIYTFATKGGFLYSVVLKDYMNQDSLPVCLFKGPDSQLSFTLVTSNNRILSTTDLFFTPQQIVTTDSSQIFTMRLMTNANAWLDFVYTIPNDDYMLDFAIVPHEMKNVISPSTNSLEMQWNERIAQQEKGRKFEERYAQLQYMFSGGDIESLSEQKADAKKETNRLRWVAYKDQFFSSVFIADNYFSGATFESTLMGKNTGYIKSYKTATSIAFNPSYDADFRNSVNPSTFKLYFGPNHYHTLDAYNDKVQGNEKLNLQKLVPLGWKIVSWINVILVIPMFDLFTGWGLHIGWIIFLMTLVIKLIIFPFVFKSYQSSAKMRALKPEMDAINAKYPEDKMQERQQATMALYQKAGVSPMSGCLPMLFQFPIVMAMFWFFPTAIELRGQSLWWADDLSTYDAIISWDAQIPIISYLFNNHLSLFCLLMTITNLAYTYLNMQSQGDQGGAQMKVMKWMMYLMPVFFFFVFNDYAAGLSYYYCVSLLFTILQTYIFRWTLNEDKLRAKMAVKMAKNGDKPKKSSLQERLEKMQREQQAIARENAKKQQRR